MHYTKVNFSRTLTDSVCSKSGILLHCCTQLEFIHMAYGYIYTEDGRSTKTHT